MVAIIIMDTIVDANVLTNDISTSSAEKENPKESLDDDLYVYFDIIKYLIKYTKIELILKYYTIFYLFYKFYPLFGT